MENNIHKAISQNLLQVVAKFTVCCKFCNMFTDTLTSLRVLVMPMKVKTFTKAWGQIASESLREHFKQLILQLCQGQRAI